MKAVSTRIDGMSGDFSTANPACCTSDLARSLTPDSAPSTRPPTSMLASVAVADQHGLVAGLGVGHAREVARDRQGHVLLLRAAAAAGAGILAAVAGIDRDHGRLHACYGFRSSYDLVARSSGRR